MLVQGVPKNKTSFAEYTEKCKARNCEVFLKFTLKLMFNNTHKKGIFFSLISNNYQFLHFFKIKN